MNEKNGHIKITGTEVAVIGLSCRFPGANSILEFWDNLANGKETITFFSEEELVAAGISPEVVRDPSYVKAMGILKDEVYQGFDDSFFQYTPKEAEMMDPQMRVYHECLYEALEDAGYNPETYKGAIGVFACGAPNLNWEIMVASHEAHDLNRLFEADKLYDKDYLSTRISYKLNLKGPSLFLYTACSSSLTAIHIACQSLLAGDCDMATAGGVSILFPHKTGYPYKEGMISSPDGHCRAFDEKARGTVRGNGAGVVVLKLLEDALKDNDHIYAVIKGSAINNDGREKMGYTAPSIQGQADVIRTAQAIAGIAPESVTYIEAHGTGTKIGDPVEIEALSKAFNTDKRQYCSIGSVKTNIGHCDTAAGVAGFIKTVLMLSYKKIVPSLHFKKANPKIKFDESPFTVSTCLKDWEPAENSKIAGVSSFGIGGTNVHMILGEAPAARENTVTREYTILPFSARTAGSLSALLKKYRDFFDNTPYGSAPIGNLTDIAFTLQTGRKSFEYRKAFIAKPGETLPEKIRGELSVTDSFKKASPGRPVIFLFPDKISPHITRTIDALQKTGYFGDEFKNYTGMFREMGVYSLFQGEYNEETAFQSMKDKKTSDTIVFMYGYLLARVLIRFGIMPFTLFGCGTGEITSACISGLCSVENALKLILSGHRTMQTGKSAAGSGCILSGTPAVPFVLGSTGTWIGDKEISDPGHWETIAREEACDCHGLEKIAGIKYPVLIEAGYPHSIIPLLRKAPFNKPDMVVIDPIEDVYSFYNALAQLWEAGIDINFELFYENESPKRISLPTYPFERKRFWNLAEQPEHSLFLKTYFFANKENINTSHFKDRTKQAKAGNTAGSDSMNCMEERENLEKRITSIWKEILGYTRIGPDDDFFKSGGDSIKAITLISEIERYFSLHFPLHDLFQNPTINSIVNYIINIKRGNTYDPYVVYNRGQGTNVFCFPPYVCIGLAYYELFSFMKDVTFYCFNYFNRDDILSFFADSITGIQKDSTSILFGYSAGARVAYAVAWLMEQKGHKVSDLVILDGFVRWKTMDQFFLEKEKARAKELLITYDAYTGVFKGNESFINQLVERIVQYSKLTCEIHVKEKIGAHIHLIKAEHMEKTKENEDWYEYTINNSWEKITSHNYYKYQGVARHLDMLYPEHLKANAEIIRSVFADIAEKQSASGL